LPFDDFGAGAYSARRPFLGLQPGIISDMIMSDLLLPRKGSPMMVWVTVRQVDFFTPPGCATEIRPPVFGLY
jgi:hypothetical protein